ncbi:MAG: hypothetical protein R3B67_04375 [Phycisphaerales bacterium]
MNTIRIVLAMVALMSAQARAQNGTPATNAFSFQGQLNFEDRPANVALDLTFQLFLSPTGNHDPGCRLSTADPQSPVR